MTVNSHPWLEARGLLHLDSTAILHAEAGAQLWLHSPMRSVHSDKVPVLAQHAEPEAFIDRERFTPSRLLDGNPTIQLERYWEGEPSLSGEPECLSLPGGILCRANKTGKEAALPPRSFCAEVSVPKNS